MSALWPNSRLAAWIWCWLTESKRCHPDYKSGALPAELNQLNAKSPTKLIAGLLLVRVLSSLLLRACTNFITSIFQIQIIYKIITIYAAINGISFSISLCMA